MDCTIRVAKTKALISFAVTAKLICVFVFAYAKRWFSHKRGSTMKANSKLDYNLSHFQSKIMFITDLVLYSTVIKNLLIAT